MGEELHHNTQRLVEILQSAANRTLNFVEESDFIEAYKKIFKGFEQISTGDRPPLAGSSVEAKRVRSLVHQHVLTQIKEQIDFLLQEECLDAKFRAFDQCLPMKNTKGWRPPSDAEKHMMSFEAAYKAEHRNQLRALVRREAQQLTILKDRLIAKRERAKALHASVKQKVQVIEDQLKYNEEE